MYTYICIYTYIYIDMSLSLSIYIYIERCIYTYYHIYIYTHVYCVYACMRTVSNSAPTRSSRCCFTACHLYFGKSLGRNALRLEPN